MRTLSKNGADVKRDRGTYSLHGSTKTADMRHALREIGKSWVFPIDVLNQQKVPETTAGLRIMNGFG